MREGLGLRGDGELPTLGLGFCQPALKVGNLVFYLALIGINLLGRIRVHRNGHLVVVECLNEC